MVLNSIDPQAKAFPPDVCSMELRADSNILILDFDHTLFLSNSTEEYLDSAFPSSLCAFVLACIDWLKPWNLLPGENKRFVYRDAIRVIVISILFPWTYFAYWFQARSLSRLYLNSEIVRVIESKRWDKTIIASNGFGFILRPLLKQIDNQFDVIINSSVLPTPKGVRRLGKRTIIQQCLSTTELENATFITDNKDDASLSGLVADLKLFRWPNERRVKAGQLAYVPFVYTHASKRGNKNHVLNVMVLQDFSIFILAYAFSNAFGVQSFFSLLFLLLSFWCVYEIGYFENDLYELKYESEHKNLDKLSYVKGVKDTAFEFSAWTWALGFGCVASFLLQPELCISLDCSYQVIATLLKWCGWLIALRILYRLYNYSKFGVRQFIFPLLQVARLAGPILFLSTNFLGLFLITSQMASRWLGYLIYRGGGDERRVQKRIVRHVIFAILSVGLAVVQKDPGIILSWQFSLMLLWSLMQGHASTLMKSIKRFANSSAN